MISRFSAYATHNLYLDHCKYVLKIEAFKTKLHNCNLSCI